MTPDFNDGIVYFLILIEQCDVPIKCLRTAENQKIKMEVIGNVSVEVLH